MKDRCCFFSIEDLPKPLTAKETLEQFECFQWGGDLKARNNLIEHNIRLVLHLVEHRFSGVAYDKSDLVSIGLLGLIKAVDTFEIERKLSFSTYAGICIFNEIGTFLRKYSKFATDYSLDDPIAENLTLADSLMDPATNIALDYEKKEEREIIYELIDKLPERENEIIQLYFGFKDGVIHTQQEIANRVDISQAQVSRIIKRVTQQWGVEDYFTSYCLKGTPVVGQSEASDGSGITLCEPKQYKKEKHA